MSLVQHLTRAPRCQARFQEDAEPATRTAVKAACLGVAGALVVALAVPAPFLIALSVGVCLATATLMFAVPRAWSLAPPGSTTDAMAARAADPYWNSETFTFALVGGLLALPMVLGAQLLSTAVLIVLITALLLAGLTPFCLGRLTYALLFYRDDQVA